MSGRKMMPWTSKNERLNSISSENSLWKIHHYSCFRQQAEEWKSNKTDTSKIPWFFIKERETEDRTIRDLLHVLLVEWKKLSTENRKLQREHKKGVRIIMLKENYFQIISFQITSLFKLKTWKVVWKKTSRILWLHQSLKKREKGILFRASLPKSFWCLGMNFLPSSPLLLGRDLMPIYIYFSLYIYIAHNPILEVKKTALLNTLENSYSLTPWSPSAKIRIEIGVSEDVLIHLSKINRNILKLCLQNSLILYHIMDTSLK